MPKLVPPIVSTSITIVLAGALIGYVGTAAVGTFVTDLGVLPGSTGEQPAARQFVVKMLEHKTDQLQQLRPQQDKNGAQRCKQKVAAENDQDRQDPERAKSAQAFRELILPLVRHRCALKIWPKRQTSWKPL